MQDFESEGFPIGAEHSQKVKAAPIGKPYGSKDCVDLPSSTAVSRIIDWLNLLSLSRSHFFGRGEWRLFARPR